MKKIKMAYGTDEENMSSDGEFESFEQAFEEAITECDAEVGQTIYVCEIHPYQWNVSADYLIEQMNNDAYSECGEYVDGWPDCNKEEVKLLQKQLDLVVGKWLKKIKQDKPRFWKCGKSTSFEVTQDRLDKLGK